MMTLGELLAMFEPDEPRRHPVLRSGERAPIPAIVRLAVYRRDDFACKECGWTDREALLQLDHRYPWSAGGGDESSNLRTLCQRCNVARSNWNDGAQHAHIRPVTWWCWHCWRDPDLSSVDPYDAQPSKPRPPWKNGVDLGRAPRVTSPSEQAFCAFCNHYSFTNVLFDTEANQNRLAEICDLGRTA